MSVIARHVVDGGAPIWCKPMLVTPFFECYEPYIETRAFRMWSGYNTLTYFSSIEHEYFAVRNTASLFDLTPMIKYDIRGPDAEVLRASSASVFAPRRGRSSPSRAILPHC